MALRSTPAFQQMAHTGDQAHAWLLREEVVVVVVGGGGDQEAHVLIVLVVVSQENCLRCFGG